MLLRSFLLLFAISASASGQAIASDTGPIECFLVVTDAAAANQRADLLSGLTELVGETLATGSILHLVAAPDHEPVATLTIGDGGRNARLRDRSIRQPLVSIVEWCQSDERAEGSGQIQLPELPGVVRSMRRSDYPLRIIVIADPVYDSPAHPLWSMRERRAPSDAAAIEPPSPYAIGGSFPEGARVDWGLLETNWGADADHRDAIERFWRVWFQSRGARLDRFSLDLAAVFAGSDEPVTEPIEVRPGRPGMVETGFRPVDGGVARGGFEFTPAPREESSRIASESSDATRSASPTSNIDESETPPTSPAVVTPPARRVPTSAPTPTPQTDRSSITNDAPADPVRVAIAWKSDDPTCDLDLRVQHNETGEELTYRTPQSSFGIHLGDTQSSGSCEVCSPRADEWESVLLRRDQIRDVSIWINAYQTSAPAEVELRISYKGRSRTDTLLVDANEGDSARDADHRGDSPAWIEAPILRRRTASSTPEPRQQAPRATGGCRVASS